MREAIHAGDKDTTALDGFAGRRRGHQYALLVDADPQKAAKEIVSHAGELQADATQIAVGCVLAAANVVIKLDIKLNFK